MNRHKPKADPPRTRARIVWRDGRFRLECCDQGDAMRIAIYDEHDVVVAEEQVASATDAWARGSALCRQLDDGDRVSYERGSA